MHNLEGLIDCLPALRRYTRFVTGSRDFAEALCRAALGAMSDIHPQWPPGRDTRIQAYRAVSTLLNTPSSWDLAGWHADKEPKREIEDRARRLTPWSRQAYILMTMEGFSFKEAAKILDLEPGELDSWLALAKHEIANQVATTVLIIEDEVFIARDLEKIVKGLGHSVVAKVRTRGAARAVISSQKPGIILADIQLADGSSGIDAVNDWLREQGSIPIIFITAYPDQLITGERPEPAFLIAKPFQVNEVQAAINQVLFFKATSTIPKESPRWAVQKLNGLPTAGAPSARVNRASGRP
jgi:CheY-like chemotaxis protein